MSKCLQCTETVHFSISVKKLQLVNITEHLWVVDKSIWLTEKTPDRWINVWTHVSSAAQLVPTNVRPPCRLTMNLKPPPVNRLPLWSACSDSAPGFMFQKEWRSERIRSNQARSAPSSLLPCSLFMVAYKPRRLFMVAPPPRCVLTSSEASR